MLPIASTQIGIEQQYVSGAVDQRSACRRLTPIERAPPELHCVRHSKIASWLFPFISSFIPTMIGKTDQTLCNHNIDCH